MKPIHDMGGETSGSVVPDKSEDPLFEEEWHKRALGLTIAIGGMGAWTIDTSRFARESLPKADYQVFSYYEKWLCALVNLLFRNGFLTRNELLSGYSEHESKKKWLGKIIKFEDVIELLQTGSPTRRFQNTPNLSIGQRVKMKEPKETLKVRPGHTRLPHYIANKSGTIVRFHGNFVLPNSTAHFLGECPENLYSVEFRCCDLWKKHESRSDTVVVDCWESYFVTI